MTISFNYLGNLGHLGNQMFQYAALIGLSKKYNRKFCIPHQSTFGGAYYTELRSNLYDAFSIKPIQGLSRFPTVDEGQFHFNEALFNNLPPQDINLHGFFQTEKWFAHAKDEVREAFTFKPQYMEIAQEMRSQLSGDIIAIHVRRTDYLTNPNHEALGLDYYARALAEVPDDCTVIIFTDDPEWAKEQKLFPDDRFFVSETNCAYTDMALMSLCDYHIIGNSTFSWWGAWLANRGTVVAPKKWFGPNNQHLSTKDLYPASWKII